MHGLGFVVSCLVLLGPAPGPRTAQDPKKAHDPKTADAESADLIAEELRQDALQIRRGQARKAIASLEEILDEDAGNVRARILLSEALWEKGEPLRSLAAAEKASSDAAGSPEYRRPAALALAKVLTAVGRASDATTALEQAGVSTPNGAGEAWILGSALWAAGRRDPAKAALRVGAQAPDCLLYTSDAADE